VKQYERQKLQASLGSTVLNLAALAVLALVVGPWLDPVVRQYAGENAWLRLVVFAVAYGAILELVTLPLGFWSGFVLEHRHGLSNQTMSRWVWRQIKGWLVGGPLGLALLLGLYAVLWYGGEWWWVWATGAWLLVTLVLGQLLPVLILPLFYKVT